MINAHCFPFMAPNRPRLPKSRVVIETKYMMYRVWAMLSICEDKKRASQCSTL